jgi:uncharacterized membrane protein
MYFAVDADEEMGAFFVIFGLIIAVMLSPILSTIVGAIIAKDFDDESDAAFNGAIVGAIGTAIMLFVTIFFYGMAADDLDGPDSDDADEMSDDTSDMMIKIMIPCAVGGALGAFVGFRYLWAQMPATETQSGLPPLSPPQF